MSRINRTLLFVFAFVLPLSTFVGTRLLVVTLVLTLVQGKWTELLRAFRAAWDLFVFLLIIAFGMFYTADLTTGWKTLETSFGLFAAPLVAFPLLRLNARRLDQTFFYFSIGTVLASLVCLLNAFVRYYSEGDERVFLFYSLTEVIGSHPTYLAYYLIFTITYFLYHLSYVEEQRLPTILVVFICLFCLIMLLLTGGRTAFISLLFVFSFFILRFVLGENKLRQTISFALVVTMLLSMLFVGVVEYGGWTERQDDSWDRFSLWKSGMLASPDKLWGVGTGDYKTVLNEYFVKNDQGEFAQQEYNSHNQFIQIFFSNGVFGLLALALVLLRPIYVCFRFNNQLGILMLFPFLIYGMTEVFLGRSQGVLFFGLLYSAFVSFHPPIRETLAIKENLE